MIAGVLTASLAGSIFIAANQTKPLLQDVTISIASTVADTAPESSSEEISARIFTLADMIGEEEAKELITFTTTAVDKVEWLAFIEDIGAQFETVSVEHETEYTMYLLRKQDKQLVLAEKKSIGSKSAEVFYQFSDIAEPPLMIEIILEFDSR